LYVRRIVIIVIIVWIVRIVRIVIVVWILKIVWIVWNVMIVKIVMIVRIVSSVRIVRKNSVNCEDCAGCENIDGKYGLFQVKIEKLKRIECPTCCSESNSFYRLPIPCPNRKTGRRMKTFKRNLLPLLPVLCGTMDFYSRPSCPLLNVPKPVCSRSSPTTRPIHSALYDCIGQTGWAIYMTISSHIPPTHCSYFHIYLWLPLSQHVLTHSFCSRCMRPSRSSESSKVQMSLSFFHLGRQRPWFAFVDCSGGNNGPHQPDLWSKCDVFVAPYGL